jgi:hypothetical protein
MSQNAIIEKIKKLLRMKRGGAAGEIENALAAAARLAREHGIDLGTVDPDAPDAKPIGHEDAIRSSRLQDEYKYAALVCQIFFNVTSLVMDDKSSSSRRWRDWKIVFIGTEWDRKIAIYIFEFLGRHCRRCWNQRANKRLKNRSAFMNGIYQGLCQKLHEQREQEISGEGLILLGRQGIARQEYLQTHWPNTGEKNMGPANDASQAKWAGYVEGRKTEIRSAVDAAPATARAALPPPQQGAAADKQLTMI